MSERFTDPPSEWVWVILSHEKCHPIISARRRFHHPALGRGEVVSEWVSAWVSNWSSNSNPPTSNHQVTDAKTHPHPSSLTSSDHPPHRMTPYGWGRVVFFLKLKETGNPVSEVCHITPSLKKIDLVRKQKQRIMYALTHSVIDWLTKPHNQRLARSSFIDHSVSYAYRIENSIFMVS